MLTNRTDKKNIAAALLLALCIMLGTATACAPKADASYIRLDKSELSLCVGESAALVAEADGSPIVWSSDATHIATVDGGIVTAVAEGEATIKARVGNERAFCEVRVFKEGERPVKQGTLAEIYSDYFPVGAAVQTGKLTGGGYGELMKHFGSITPENNMKWRNVEASEGVFDFDRRGDSADKLVEWARENGRGVRGHCLLWYKSLPEWLHDKFDGAAYSDELKAEAYAYIDGYIEAVMKHFGNGVYVWDVVNEALSNSVRYESLASAPGAPYGRIWRTNDNMSPTDSGWVDWYRVCGGYGYIARAFIKADEVRRLNNYDVELFYNDYSLNNPNKRQACLSLIKMLRDCGAPIDGIGMQAHYRLEDYSADKKAWLRDFEASVRAFTEAGVDVQITELDIRFDGALTEEKEAAQAEMYGDIFAVCRKYAKINGAENGVTGVTFWGVHDGSNGAWGSNQYPLVFGTDKLPKKAYYKIIDF